MSDDVRSTGRALSGVLDRAERLVAAEAMVEASADGAAGGASGLGWGHNAHSVCTSLKVAECIHLPMDLFRIPRAFYDDHNERGLPAPDPVRETTRHVWIDPADPDFQELVDDAEFYADPDGPDLVPNLKRAAKAMLRSIEDGERHG